VVAGLTHPLGMAIDFDDNVLLCERSSITKINKVTLNTRTIAGTNSGVGYKNGLGSNSLFREPIGIISNKFGVLYVSDDGNHVIRKLTPIFNISSNWPQSHLSMHHTLQLALVELCCVGSHMVVDDVLTCIIKFYSIIWMRDYAKQLESRKVTVSSD